MTEEAPKSVIEVLHQKLNNILNYCCNNYFEFPVSQIFILAANWKKIYSHIGLHQSILSMPSQFCHGLYEISCNLVAFKVHMTRIFFSVRLKNMLFEIHNFEV